MHSCLTLLTESSVSKWRERQGDFFNKEECLGESEIDGNLKKNCLIHLMAINEPHSWFM